MKSDVVTEGWKFLSDILTVNRDMWRNLALKRGEDNVRLRAEITELRAQLRELKAKVR